MEVWIAICCSGQCGNIGSEHLKKHEAVYWRPLLQDSLKFRSQIRLNWHVGLYFLFVVK